MNHVVEKKNSVETKKKPDAMQQQLDNLEKQKQAEVENVKKETRWELNSLQQFVENIKSTITNFWTLLGTALSSFKSFFSGRKRQELAQTDSADDAPKNRVIQSEIRWPYSAEYLRQHPFDVKNVLKQPLMNKVKENKTEFAQWLCNLAAKHGGRPEWYLAVMGNETAGTMSPSIQNSDTLATGLFQFMPDTAKWLWTSVSALKKMSNIEQLVYVDKYLTQVGATGKINSLSDLYAAVFFPAALKYSWNANYVFESRNLSAGKVARANPMFNKNKDGKITMREFKSVVNNTVGWRLRNVPLDNIA